MRQERYRAGGDDPSAPAGSGPVRRAAWSAPERSGTRAQGMREVSVRAAAAPRMTSAVPGDHPRPGDVTLLDLVADLLAELRVDRLEFLGVAAVWKSPPEICAICCIASVSSGTGTGLVVDDDRPVVGAERDHRDRHLGVGAPAARRPARCGPTVRLPSVISTIRAGGGAGSRRRSARRATWRTVDRLQAGDDRLAGRGRARPASARRWPACAAARSVVGVTSTVAIPAKDTMPRLTPGVRSSTNCVAASCAAASRFGGDVVGLHGQRHVDGEHHRGPVPRLLGVGGRAGQRDGQQHQADQHQRGRQVPPAARPARRDLSPAVRGWRTASCAAGCGAAPAGSRRRAPSTSSAAGQPARLGEVHQASPARRRRPGWRRRRSSRACGTPRTASRRRSSPGRCAAPGARHRPGAARRRPAPRCAAAASANADRSCGGGQHLLRPAGLRVDQGHQPDVGQLQLARVEHLDGQQVVPARTAPAAAVPSSSGPMKSEITTASPRRRGGRRSCSSADRPGRRGRPAPDRGRRGQRAAAGAAGAARPPAGRDPGAGRAPVPTTAPIRLPPPRVRWPTRGGRGDHQVPLLAAGRCRSPATPTGRPPARSPAPGRRPSAGRAARWCGR